LTGYGAITPAEALRIAADPTSTWRRLLTDPATGQVLDYGQTRYRPPNELAEIIRLRDGTCVMPTCNAAASRCDLDHTIPFSGGGTTGSGNLGALCRHHHLLKTHGGWDLEQPRSGTFVWTTPAGRVIRTVRGDADTQTDAIAARTNGANAPGGNAPRENAPGGVRADPETEADPPPF